jgi:hypothetical protein
VSAVAAVDLDRTLVYSPSALLLDENQPQVRRLVCVEIYRGRPLSFVTESAADGIVGLNERGVLVPVTTRTVEQYRRISLPGPAPKFAVCANGGRLLRDGVEDLDFTAAVEARLAESGAPLAEVYAELSRVSSPTSASFVEQIRDASGLFCYAVVERESLPTGWIEGLSAFATERSWGISVQGRKVYLVPSALTKAIAAREVADMLGYDVLLAAGDSLLDAELLEVADAAIRPAHGELDAAGWTRDHVQVTAAAGVLAGAEIVEWMLDRTSR